MKVGQKIIIIAGLALAVFLPAVQSYADDTSANISIAKFITNLKMGGDIRIREESFYREPKLQAGNDQARERFRLRWGITPQIEDFTVFFRLASGNGQQVSTNQTFDTLGSEKQIWIDQAAVQWKAFEWLKLTGGKMPNPIWMNYTTDVVWDPDINPEGFAEQFDYSLHQRLSVFSNFLQSPLRANNGVNKPDAWLFAYQAGVKTKIMDETKVTLAGSFYDFRHETQSDLTNGGAAIAGNAAQTQDGNSPRIGNIVKSSFSVLDITAEIKTRLWKWPLSIQGDYINNLADNGVLLSSGTEKIGYQVGLILGNASAANTWEIAYFYKWLENDATLADLADSDFGNGGTNRRGHIFWIAYSPRDYVQLKAKYFVTETIRQTMSPFVDNINRLQVDLLVKF